MREERESGEGRGRTLAESIPQIVWATTADGRIEYYNGRWYEYTGRSREGDIEDSWHEVVHPADYERAFSAWRHSLASGDPFAIEFRLRRNDGAYRWFYASALPVHDEHGAVVRWFGTCTDIEDRVLAERTLQFLLDAGDTLGASLDVERTLQSLARIAVPRLAEWCSIYLLEEDGGVTPAAFAHEDADFAQRALAMVRRYPTTRSTAGILAVIESGVSILVPVLAPHDLEEAAHDAQHLAELRALGGIGSVLTVPLSAGGVTIGALQLLNSPGGNALTDADRRIAEALAARASIALDNARLFARERQIAAAFQNAALPVRLPLVDGVVLDAVYAPGSSEALVGGDWYDALRLRDGRLVLSVGDVAGSGLEAAVIMQAVRQAVRTTAHVYVDPLTIIDAADRTLKTEYPDRIVTAFVAIYDPIERQLLYALAGHPPPLVRHPDGEVEALVLPGLPLGLRERNEDVANVFPFAAGDLLVMYTDGVLEATHDVLEGAARLRLAVEPLSADDREAAHAVAASSLAPRSSDDIAILTLGIVRSSPGVCTTWAFDALDAVAAREARLAFNTLVAARGPDAGAQYAAELVFGELVGNVVRHATGSLEITFVDDDRYPVLHVLDRGPGFVLTPHLPSDLLAERGRGLYLVWTLTEEFNLSRRAGGGSHARAVLRLRSA